MPTNSVQSKLNQIVTLERTMRKTGNELGGSFVASIKRMKFHKPTCEWAECVAPRNRVQFANRGDAVSHGYKRCRTCKP